MEYFGFEASDLSNDLMNREALRVFYLAAGVNSYAAVDVGTSSASLNNEYEKALHASYNDDFLQRIFATVELFAKYDNTLLFFSGNEVINKGSKSWAVRLKSYVLFYYISQVRLYLR